MIIGLLALLLLGIPGLIVHTCVKSLSNHRSALDKLNDGLLDLHNMQKASRERKQWKAERKTERESVNRFDDLVFAKSTWTERCKKNSNKL